MPKRHTYTDTDGNAKFHSYADRKPDADRELDAKGDTDAKAQAIAEASSCCTGLKVSYSSLGTTI